MSRNATGSAIVSLLNLKGGVGKTHSTWLLAGVCEERDLRSLCIDLDPQGNLSRNLLADRTNEPGVESLFYPGSDGEMGQLVRSSRFSSIDVIPASHALAPFDVACQHDWEAVDLQQVLGEALATVVGEYEFILIDCPPRLSLVSFAALAASDHVIIPLEAADWGAQGVTQVTEAIRYVQQHENPQLNLLGYLISRFKTARSYQHAYLSKLREHFGPLAFDTVVPDLAGFEKSVTHAIPINLRAPCSREANIARELFDEVNWRIEQSRNSGARSGQCDVSTTSQLAV